VYLDDLVLLSIGFYFALGLIPETVKVDCLRKAKDYDGNKKKRWLIRDIIILFWLIIALWIFLEYFKI
tara:strand:- start:379 stop:582 length:204 start_codon:yes stop_codon:yes gene_type:complete